MTRYNFISFAGIFVLIGVAWLLSEKKRRMNWRVIGWGVAIQLALALIIFVVPAGSKLFLWVNDIVIKILDSSMAGSRFVFGRLAIPPGATGPNGEPSLGFFLAFQAFPTIIFFSALMSVLYYVDILPMIIRWFSALFARLMRISGAESMVNVANVFAGIESEFTIRPHLPEMTRSELFVVLVSGMGTVASNVLALYVFSLKAQFPTIAGHLVSATLISAPAALVMAKIIIPETETPKTLGTTIRPYFERESSLFEAIINGSMAGVKAIVGIVALLIAMLGLVSLLDLILAGVGDRINMFCHINVDWTLKGLLGYLFYPFTLVLGVPLSDAAPISRIIGERAVLTEVAAYQDLAGIMAKNVLHNPRSAVIAVYALCGFAHVASMAIFVGGTAAIAPSKTRVLSQIGFKALIASTLSCLMTACVAGTFFTGSSILMGK
jgi:concentrative nucleoside transporter, CNT family